MEKGTAEKGVPSGNKCETDPLFDSCSSGSHLRVNVSHLELSVNQASVPQRPPGVHAYTNVDLLARLVGSSMCSMRHAALLVARLRPSATLHCVWCRLHTSYISPCMGSVVDDFTVFMKGGT